MANLECITLVVLGPVLIFYVQLLLFADLGEPKAKKKEKSSTAVLNQILKQQNVLISVSGREMFGAVQLAGRRIVTEEEMILGPTLGADNIRKYWSRYYQGSQGVIFVLDSASSEDDLETARNELHSALQHPQLCTLPFLILANHQDKPAARSVQEVVRAQLSVDREYHPHPLSLQCTNTIDGSNSGSGKEMAVQSLHNVVYTGAMTVLVEYLPKTVEALKCCKHQEHLCPVSKGSLTVSSREMWKEGQY
ncbi:ADP-ribosylation factor-like protein 15 [Fukomys damarensis]|uniref:ADP-ribosylation factor-like protein 15 n=1 Tax=Fukomys damarensis TaxID=885580 RepID=A0A091DP97_FUKDA|nr:ADP-ribosylation factor-like protein 15 [Fukomys damarensis]